MEMDKIAQMNMKCVITENTHTFTLYWGKFHIFTKNDRLLLLLLLLQHLNYFYAKTCSNDEYESFSCNYMTFYSLSSACHSFSALRTISFHMLNQNLLTL